MPSLATSGTDRAGFGPQYPMATVSEFLRPSVQRQEVISRSCFRMPLGEGPEILRPSVQRQEVMSRSCFRMPLGKGPKILRPSVCHKCKQIVLISNSQCRGCGIGSAHWQIRRLQRQEVFSCSCFWMPLGKGPHNRAARAFFFKQRKSVLHAQEKSGFNLFGAMVLSV